MDPFELYEREGAPNRNFHRLPGRIWPRFLAAVTLPTVGGPAAVASYRHAGDVVARHGDPVMVPWFALATDGMLLAALVVIWVRPHRHERRRAQGHGPRSGPT